MGFESAVASGRRLIDSTLLDTATIMRRTMVSDGAGGKTESFVAESAAVACRFGSIVDPNPIEQVDGVFGVPTAQVFFAVEAEIGVREGDRIINNTDGSTWVAVGSKTPASAFAVVDRVLIREI